MCVFTNPVPPPPLGLFARLPAAAAKLIDVSFLFGRAYNQESRAAEDEKQQRMKEERNDKAKRRAAMCENLGRGC